ncbi:MAG: AmmeMemoRadiSam system protein B [Proteobacteria bacterium]|nr:AmmeMemoRadiSam system protein B [Pseudomonadota bacterium]MBU1688686.1 AmmeMemoRadiSam system protein B [Pseudomonadota bacterium]
MIRHPAVAGQFYPASPTDLKRMLHELMEADSPPIQDQAIAVVSPHAGYIYSGGVAGETFAKVIVPENVILIGPNHHGLGAPIALMSEGVWEMPMGAVDINQDLADCILQTTPGAINDHLSHRYEHSLEVQIPFLQIKQERLTIVPLVVSHLSLETCLACGKSIATAIKAFGKPVLLVASSDMTHYESREIAQEKDTLALNHLLRLDPEGLFQTVRSQRISMCGVIPTTIVIAAALALGGKATELIRYTDSGEASGDLNRVVGYAGVIIS